MLGPLRTDGLWAKESLGGDPLLGEEIFRPVAERPAEPALDGNTEAALGPLDQLARHVAVEDLAQEPFPTAVPEPHLRAPSSRAIDHTVVPARHAGFQTHSPARS